MVKLDKIYTRGGDKGKTSLGNGKRIDKTNIRIEAFAAVDETNAILGIAIQNLPPKFRKMIQNIQNDLFDLGADLCVPEEKNPKYEPLRISQNQIDRLEQEIDIMNASLETLTSFILPGGTIQAANLHLGRTLARKAEILINKLNKKEKINPLALKYINRLSDHLFVAARAINKYKKTKDVLWIPGKSR